MSEPAPGERLVFGFVLAVLAVVVAGLLFNAALTVYLLLLGSYVCVINALCCCACCCALMTWRVVITRDPVE